MLNADYLCPSATNIFSPAATVISTSHTDTVDPGQHEFELCGSTYTRIFFFNIKYYGTMIPCWLNLRMRNHVYGRTAYKEEPCIQSVDYKLFSDFQLWGGERL